MPQIAVGGSPETVDPFTPVIKLARFATALETGHDHSVLFRKYRELVKPKDAQAYWQIVPEAHPPKKPQKQKKPALADLPANETLDLIAGKIS